MINEQCAMKYCKDDITKIENYELAKADTSHTWDCHHRLELTLDGKYAHSKEELIRMDMYYARPYFELIFLTHVEHQRLHKHRSDDTRRKLSEAKKGKHRSDDTRRKIAESHKGKHRSEFGKKFKEHYNMTPCDNRKLYKREHQYYTYHGKYSWER